MESSGEPFGGLFHVGVNLPGGHYRPKVHQRAMVENSCEPPAPKKQAASTKKVLVKTG